MGYLFKKFWPLFFITAFIFAPKLTFAADWVNVGFADKSIKTVFVDPKNNQHLLVSLVSYLDNNYNYYTENGGTTWQPINLGGAITPCNNFVTNPKSSSEVWAGCAVGLFHSTDGGKNFAVIPNYRTTQGVSVSISENGTFYMASTGNNLHRSVGGVIWEVLSAPGGSSQPVVFLNKYSPNEVYVSAMNSGLYRSADTGSTWVLVNNQAQIRSGVGQMTFDVSGKICASVSVTGIGCSTDGGFTWSTFVSPNLEKPVEYEHFYQLVQNPDDDANLLVLTGTWGGLDTKIYSYKSGVAIPEVTALSQSFSSMAISQGVVFASAQSTGWTKGFWRNDGIAVMPEYLKKHPVIIVPGMLGSWFIPATGKWTLDPVLKTYDDLYYSFINAGYEPNKDIFVFPYQWRNDNKYTAGLLATKIKEAKLKSGSNKVDIIAHSMGGLVTRFYAESEIYDNDINQIFFLGTPQLGSTNDYPLWEAGYTGFEDIYFGMLLKFILNEESVTSGYFGHGAVREYIHNEIPSVKQLLPIYSYLNSNIYPIGHPRNTELEDLNSNSHLLEDRNINVINIIGETGANTLGGLSVVGSNQQPLWEYGAPIGLYTGNIFEGVGYAHGDGTVTTQSQSFIKGKNYVLDGVKHAKIPKYSVETIFAELGLRATPMVTDSINNILMINAYSPIDFYVLAPDGKRIGFNKDGAAFNEIEGAFYTGNDTETEFLTIPNPLHGEYRVIAYGTGTGSYEIEATYADDSDNTSMTSSYNGQATPGKENKLLVELNPETNSIETKIDDKFAPVTTATLEGNRVNEYYNTDVTVGLTAIDTESGVKKTEYSLDGAVWQDYTGPIVLSKEEEALIYYHSVDQANNIEGTQNLVIKIDKTAPIVSVTLNKTNFIHWDKLILTCKAEDDYSGIREFVVKLDGATIDCTKPVNLFEQTLGSHKIKYTAVDNAGNSVTGEKSYQLVVNYDSLVKDIVWLYDNKHFKNKGDAVSLLAQIEVSRLFNAFGMKKMATNVLSQTVNFVDKMLSKKQISSVGYDIITKDFKYILEGK